MNEAFLPKHFYVANLYQECLGVSFTLIFTLSFDIRIITFTLVANNLTVKADTGLFKENTKTLLEQPSWSLTDSSFIPELVADVRYEGKVWKTEESALMQKAQR